MPARNELMRQLELAVPVVGAPMAGGTSGVPLVTAVAGAGGLGFLAGGYQTVAALAEQIRATRVAVPMFGVNLFAPNPLPVGREEFERYAGRLAGDRTALGLEAFRGAPVEDDDAWNDKVDLLTADPVPVVSFTFGLPDRRVVSGLRRAGSVVLLTVTTATEAVAAAELGPDALVVQGYQAGGHSATLDPRSPSRPLPTVELVTAVRSVTELPLVAAGGLAAPADLVAVRQAGASASVLGTALLRTPESGASSVHKAALADPLRTQTVVTRAFTGRPARALRNGFTDRHSGAAPHGYPALHHLTGPLRKAAAAAGDAERLHLWAGTGYRHARQAPAAEVVGELSRLL